MSSGSLAAQEENRLPLGVDHAAVAMLLGWIGIAMCWWGLAFFPVAAGDQTSWLARAQYVCFGKMPGTALPASGWLLLFGGPLALLGALLAVYGGELRTSVTALYRSRTSAILLSLLALAFAAETIWVGVRIREESKLATTSFEAPEAGGLPAEYPRTDLPAPEFSLVDQFGATVSLESLKGKPTIVTFVFAHCTTVCPALVKTAVTALEKLTPELAQGIFITLDPWRDRPSTLPGLAKRWGFPTNAHLLSGKIDDVNVALERFQVPRTRDEKTGDVVHPALVYVLDAQARIAYRFNNPTPRWLGDAIGRLRAER